MKCLNKNLKNLWNFICIPIMKVAMLLVCVLWTPLLLLTTRLLLLMLCLGMHFPILKELPHIECIPYKIPLGIIESVMNNCYVGDGTVHLNIHLLKLTELCELLKRLLLSSSIPRKSPLAWHKLLSLILHHSPLSRDPIVGHNNA